jgi:hypothetical protein
MKTSRKFILLTLSIFFVIAINSNAQDIEKNSSPQYKSLLNRGANPAFVTFDLGFVQTQLHGRNLYGGNMQLNIALNDLFYTGIYTQISGTSNIVWPTELPVETINPVYNHFFFGINNGLLFFPKSTITIGLPIRFGLGGVSIIERYNTFAEARGQIAQDYFFAVEPGFDAYLNLFKHLSIGTGFSYRFTSGVNRAGTNRDFNQLFWHLGVRIRIFEGDLE